MKILLVEDDLIQLEALKAGLMKVGYGVDGVSDGAIADDLIRQRSYDLLILDWLLPNVSGIQLCQRYRQLGHAAPVLFLTAKDAIPDRITGLDAGADDYMVKPINVMEFLARVRALGRRSPSWQGDVLKLGDLTLDRNAMMVGRTGEQIRLSSREFQLMDYLIRHPRQILTHDQIEQTLWEWDVVPDSKAVTTLVYRLRQRLQRVGAGEWLQSIYGMGYRLAEPGSE
jgi:DNA-binding response OmpR family regulator